MGEQVGFGLGLVGVAEEVFQELGFFSGESDTVHGAIVGVITEVGESEQVLGLKGRAATERLDASDQLGGFERFGEIVIGAGF